MYSYVLIDFANSKAAGTQQKTNIKFISKKNITT